MLAAGPIQVIVNNAGVHDDAVFPAMRVEQWRRVIEVSVDGFFNVTQPLVMARSPQWAGWDAAIARSPATGM